MKKVVITGGAGFIGSHLAEELVRQGYHVTILDDLSTGRMENIEELLSGGNAEFMRGSITDLQLLRKVFEDVRYVFHHAAIASVPKSIADPLTTHETNITGTLNVLMAARENSVQKVVYASSCAVYGDNQALPVKEDTLPNPLSPYAVTKLAGEYYCRIFREVYGLATVILRYFNVFGPRQDPASDYAAVIPRFIASTSQGKPPVVFGDGEQTRDFVFVRDVTEANILAAESNAQGVFNIGSGESTTVNKLAKLIISLSGRDMGPIHQEPRVGDIRHSRADASKAKVFGYEPKHSLEQGLKQCINWRSVNEQVTTRVR